MRGMYLSRQWQVVEDMPSCAMGAPEGRRTALEGGALFFLIMGAIRSVGRDTFVHRRALPLALLGIPVVAVSGELARFKMRSGLIYRAPRRFTLGVCRWASSQNPFAPI